MSITAMKQAFDALLFVGHTSRSDTAIAVCAEATDVLRQAIAQAEKQQALDKKADNARELGLDYESTHTDHPARHWDRTCPACVEQAEKQTSAAKFWQSVYPDGWTAERVEAEMTDYYNLLDGMDSLIDYVTGGAISKPLTDKSVIRMKHDEHVNKMIEEAIQEATLQEISDIGQEIEQAEKQEKFCDNHCTWRDHHSDCVRAEKQEPVAWRWLYNGKPDSHKCFDGKGPDADVILRAASSVMPRTVQYFYTAPPSKPWVSLTDEEIKEGAKYSWVDYQAFQSVAWWADEKLKEKNNG